MPRLRDRLTALKVSRLRDAGLYADGGGLYLQITSATARSWVYRFRHAGRKTPRDMGLGSAFDVSLMEARQLAAAARDLLRQGLDPIHHRKLQTASMPTKTFAECAEAYIAAHKGSWRNSKHVAQWEATLKAYAYPSIGVLPVSTVDVGCVVGVLEPIWKAKTETASRLRGRIEAILDWARTRGFRSGDNPARWRGHLDNLLPLPTRVRRVQHHAALPFSEVGHFMAQVRKQSGDAARALELLILTATRTSEVLNARTSEFDLRQAIWTIPAERIKAGREHRIPLSKPALALVRQILHERSDGDLLFPNMRSGKALSTNALLALLKRLKRTDITVHGFRSTFRDWAAEQTNYPRDVAEMALAHAIPDRVEAAYRRGDLLAKRSNMMNDWASYCASARRTGSSVIAFRSTRK
ncbi:MAG: tyrosine-type recombinase/integrase [Rhodospirillaceae bacterium]